MSTPLCERCLEESSGTRFVCAAFRFYRKFKFGELELELCVDHAADISKNNCDEGFTDFVLITIPREA